MKPATDDEVLQDAWLLAEEEAKKLPPFLQPGELTSKSLLEAHPERFNNINDARSFLDKLVRQGKMERQERRCKKGGSHIFAYVKKRKPKN